MAGRIESRIDAAELAQHPGHGVPHALLAGHIAGQPNGPRQFGGHRLGATGVDVENSHSAALLGIAAGHGRGQPRATPCGQQDPAFETLRHG